MIRAILKYIGNVKNILAKICDLHQLLHLPRKVTLDLPQVLDPTIIYSY